MFLFCLHHSFHINRRMAQTVAALREAGAAAAVHALGEDGREELTRCGQPALPPAWMWALGPEADAEIEQYVARYDRSGEAPNFHGLAPLRVAEVSLKTFAPSGRGREVASELRAALRHILVSERVFALFQPTCVVLWNGLLADGAAYRARAERHGAAITYIERGPLPDTMFVDREGVNGGSSVARAADLPAAGPADEQWAEDLLKSYLSSEQSAWEQPPSMEESRLLADLGLPRGTRIALFAGQVVLDTNIVLYSPFPARYPEVFQWLARAYGGRDDVVLVLKRHPKGPSLAAEARQALGPNAKWVETGNIRQWLSLCHHVVTVNSTVGLEAALCGKPAILMGAAHYGGPKTANKGLTWDAGSPEELSRAVEAVLREPSPSAARAAKARMFLAQLHGRGHLLRTDHDGDLRVWVKYLLRLAPAIRSGVDPDACVRFLTEHPQGAAIRLGEARWRSNYRRLAGAFPVRQMLWLRRRLLGIPDPPREGSDG